jgi:hypothetical protein
MNSVYVIINLNCIYFRYELICMEQIEIDDIVLRCIINIQNIERNDLDFPKLLSAANPFTLFDDMTYEDLVDKILFRHKEKSEETIRGTLIECIAIQINNKVQGGFKSKEIDVDLEVPTTNSYYGLKNSPNWGNANQQRAVSQTNQKMRDLGKIFAVLCSYGRSIKRKVDKYKQYGGQESWSIISNGDETMYKKVHTAINNNKVAYRQFIENIYICDRQRAIDWMITNFQLNNKLDLTKINEYISSRNKVEVTKW